MWNRLISVVEEQALTLLRTAFSTSVREAGELSAGVFDEPPISAAQTDRGARASMSPLTYPRAYACYGLKCAIAADIPNNTASLAGTHSPFRGGVVRWL